MSNVPSFSLSEVLVVEDDFPQLQLFIEALMKAGIRATGCMTLSQALDALKVGNNFRVLVTDIKLSDGTSGFELAEIAHRRQQDLPVLFITGSSKEMAYRLKFADQTAELMLKPFKLDAFVDKVATLLIQHRT